MAAALDECRNNGMKVAAAARLHNVPRKTLSDRLRSRVSEDCTGAGRPSILLDEEEKSLCNYIEYMANRGFPLTINQIKMYAWCIDKKNGRNKFGEAGLTEGWWNCFKKRNPESVKVKLRKPDSLDRGRALCATADNLRAYFSLLKKVLEDNDFSSHPQDIYNCDETVVDLNKSCQKVVIPKWMKLSHSRQVASSEHISILCCVNAAGHSIPPFIIYKNALPGGHYVNGGPDGALYGKQKTEFMDRELFSKWLRRLFIPHARPSHEHPVLLLVDGHASHCVPEVVQICKENNVILLALAPHTTHLCQPLDVAVYKSLKMNISKTVKIGQALKGDLWITKTNVARMLKDPLENSLTIPNIKSGFRKCGIHPFDPNAIDKSHLF